MAWSTAGRNARADATAALITHISLHSADPGATGTDEVTGGGYARIAPDYATTPAAAGVTDLEAPLDFSTPASQTVSHIGYWATSVWLGGFARTSGDAAANAAGEYTVSSAPITAAA
jgi:hypothetical protein